MELLLHPQTKTAYEAVFTGRSHGYVFSGASSSGRRAAALAVARRFGCAAGTGQDECAHCRRVDADASPDVVNVAPAEGKGIGVAEIRALVSAMSLAAYGGSGRRVVIIDGAETMSPAAQNALLKLAEEPPAGTVLLLIVPEAATLLPTLRSRLAEVNFRPVAEAEITAWLERGAGATPARAILAAGRADGRPGTALAALTASDAPEPAAGDIDQPLTILDTILFARLVRARSLADDGQAAAFAARLQPALVAATRDGSLAAAVAATALQAVERHREALAANVGPRAALERLMLELPCSR